MAIDIGRRQFISALGGATIAWPLAASAQQLRTPVIGYLSSISKEPDAYMLVGFRQGLADLGFIENQNVTFIYRYADGAV